MNKHFQINILILILIVAFLTISATAIAGKWGFNGSRPITEADHLPHKQKPMYYMEQWSGTTYFGKDHVLHFNLVYSKLTTKSKKGLFRVEYKTPDGKKIEDSERCELKIKRNPFTLVCGKGVIQGPIENLKVVWKGEKLPVAIKMKALAKPFRPGNGRLVSLDDSGDFYDFMLSIPRARSIAKVGDKVLKGNTMVDHSYTNIGLHKISRHFVRNTYIDDKVSIIFAANWLKDGRSTGWVSIVDNKGRSFSSEKVEFKFEDIWQDKDKDGYFAPRSMFVKSTGKTPFSMTMKNMEFTRKKDMLGHLNKLESFVVRRFSDPIRYNFSGKVEIDWQPEDKLERIERDITVSFKQLNE